LELAPSENCSRCLSAISRRRPDWGP
jgi:hypothetical protein